MERILLRKELRKLAEEEGLTDPTEINNFVREELELAERREREKKEEEERKERERREFEERQIQAQLEKEKQQREFELETERERTRQKELEKEALEINPSHNSSASSPMHLSEPSQTVDPGFGFQMNSFVDSEDEIDEFLDRFEKLATTYGLSQDKWALKLSSLLQHKSYQIYAQLTPAARNSYEEIKAALYRHFEVTATSYRHRFRNAKRRKTETFSQLTDRLRFLLQRWIQMADMGEDYEGLMNLMLAEQILDSMHPDIRNFVRQNGAMTLADINATSDRYLRAQEETRLESKFKDSNLPQNKNGNRNHSNGSDKKNKSKFTELKPKYCSNCKATSHNLQECWKKKTTGKTSFNRVAVKAKGNNHMENPRHPTSEVIEVNGLSCKVLYDTGLDFSCIVKPHLVPTEQYTGNYVDIQCASTDLPVMKLPIANIEINK